MGLVQMIKDNEGDETHYQFDLYTSADEIVPLIGKDEVDIALIPTNLAATLYQRTEGGVQVLDHLYDRQGDYTGVDAALPA